MYRIEHYTTAAGDDLIGGWLTALRDRRAAARIAARLLRLEAGLFGDCKPIDRGVCEMRIDEGPGYRVYYARSGRTVVLLLCAGTKSTQRRDIERAIAYWADWNERN